MKMLPRRLSLGLAYALLSACTGTATGPGGETSSTPAAASAEPPAPASGSPAGGSPAAPPTDPNMPAPSVPGTPANLPTGRVTGNPFVGTTLYINPDYTRAVTESAARLPAGSADAALFSRAKSLPTGIWLDSIAALAGGSGNAQRMGLAAHLEAALQQGAATGKPPMAVFVVYNLPNRDCAAAASNGQLQGRAGLGTYRTQYIDVIAATLASKPEFAKVRVALVIEPDSLPNMVTNLSLPACAAVKSPDDLYHQGVLYALQTFAKLPNVYLYLDIAHAGWLGWPSNMDLAVPYYVKLIKAVKGGDMTVVRGFATDIANYTPLVEPFISPTKTPALLTGAFYQSNPIFDEQTFVAALSSRFTTAGMVDFGFITDTSRSGWKLLNDGRPIDRRKQRSNWCNVGGSGLGVRPQVAPAHDPHLDALFYVKPPGESDGAASAPAGGVSADGKRFDVNCSPTNPQLDALPEAPEAGAWFDAEYQMLLRNATPAL